MTAYNTSDCRCGYCDRCSPKDRRFRPGDRVHVANNHPYAGLDVTVVRYWRNGYFIVREDRFQTTVAADADKLTKV